MSTFTPMTAQCRAKYLLHVDGNAYSASLKYKLACGSLVIALRSWYHEWFYPGLEEGKHYVVVDSWAQFNATLRRFRGDAGDAQARRIAAQGMKFARQQLVPSARNCYWYHALRHYLRLHPHSHRTERT